MKTTQTTETASDQANLQSIYERRIVRRCQLKTMANSFGESVIDARLMAHPAMDTEPWKLYVFTNSKTIR